MDAEFMLLGLDAAWLADAIERRAGGTGNTQATVAPSVLEPYCMDAATTSLELHGSGIHAV